MSNTWLSRGVESIEMSTSAPHRLSRGTAERLLDGSAGPHPVSQLLAAARGPAGEREVAGEAAAIAAFAAAVTMPSPAHSPRRPSPAKPSLTNLLTAKVLMGFAVTTTAGGVALAAATGGLPLPSPPAAPPAAPAGPAQEATDNEPARSANGPAGVVVNPPTAAPRTPELSPVNIPASVSSPSPGELCQAWMLRMDSGTGNLTSYCAGTPAPTSSPATPTERPSTAPGDTARPTETPSTRQPRSDAEPQEPATPDEPPPPEQPDRPVLERIVDRIDGILAPERRR